MNQNEDKITNKKINAFIVAAGYGERLRPITAHIPKPLLPICGRPVIETVLDRISCLSPDIIGINTHYKSEQIRNWRNNHTTYRNISLFHEASLLGTGGALKNAESMLSNSDFLVHNADILTDIDLERLLKRHFASTNIATLAVHDHHKFNNVWIDDKGHLKSVGNKLSDDGSRLCKIAFMGIAVYSPEILHFLPGENSSVVDAWLNSIGSGHTIGTMDFSGSDWTDIGTPDAYAAAVFDAIKKDGEIIYVHESVDCCASEFNGNVAIEKGVIIQVPSFLSNSILMPGAQITEYKKIENAIVGPDFIVPISRADNREVIPLSESVAEWFDLREVHVNAVSVGSGGSDRTYHRISHNNRQAILMTCSATDQDYIRHISFTRLFSKYSLPVPDLLVADEQNKQALFEDLGDMSLYSWLKCRRTRYELEDLYKKILDIAVLLHVMADDQMSEYPMLRERVFDYDYLRWETGYFMECFIKSIGIINNSGPDLNAEFDSLARDVDTFPKSLLHRDFQSQNIMITVGNIPRLIDYQGLRLGPAAYDIASMLWDPYYRLEDGMRERLINHYIDHRKQCQPLFSEADFLKSLLPCRLQRHMQALGAYGYLSKKKGKTYFLKHIPLALEYLKQEAASTRISYPHLHELISSLS